MLTINFEQVITVITNNSLQLVLSALVVYVLLLVINYYKKKLFSNLKCNQNQQKLDKDLTTHPIFSRMDYLLNQIDYTLEFDEGRSKLVTDIIDMKFSIARRHLVEFAKEVTKKERKNEDYNIHKLHMKYYNRLVAEYTNPKNYNASKEERQILAVALIEFQKWHKERSGLLREMSNDISDTKFYKSNLTRGFAILNVHMAILVDILHDARDTLENINGRLSGEVYKGVEIE